MDLFSLDGNTAFVTGAGSGIGQRIAVGLAEAGAAVGCLDLPDCPNLGDTIAGIEAAGGRSLALTGDVTRADDLTRAVAEVEAVLGPVSVAVNSAGIANAHPAETMDAARWQRMLDVNLTGVFRSCQAEAAVMLPRRAGSIVNIASMSGSIVNRGLLQAHYNASKAAVIHLTRSLAMEWVSHGIRVNAISPGYTVSPMNKRAEEVDRRRQFAADTPMGRMADVDEMVGPAVFLSSRAASFVTGIDLIVDGGFVCW